MEFIKRGDMVIATKIFNPMGTLPKDGGLSRKHIMSCLTRLKTDYVDLYLLHPVLEHS